MSKITDVENEVFWQSLLQSGLQGYQLPHKKTCYTQYLLLMLTQSCSSIQTVVFVPHLSDLTHDLGRRLEAELVTSSMYEGVQGLSLCLAVK